MKIIMYDKDGNEINRLEAVDAKLDYKQDVAPGDPICSGVFKDQRFSFSVTSHISSVDAARIFNWFMSAERKDMQRRFLARLCRFGVN